MLSRIIAVLIVTLLPSASVLAQEPASATSMEALDLAKQLADFGRQHADQPLALLTAAQLVLDNAPRPLTTGARGEGSTIAAPAFDVPQLLRDAKLAAPEDRNIRAIVDRLLPLATDTNRGQLHGPRGASYSVAVARSSDLLVPFVAGAHAEVRVVGNPGASVDCTVRATDGTVLASDRGSSRCMLNFVPASAEPVHIIVRNMSGGVLNYLVLTN